MHIKLDSFNSFYTIQNNIFKIPYSLQKHKITRSWMKKGNLKSAMKYKCSQQLFLNSRPETIITYFYIW